MSKLSDPHATIVREQIKRLHASINDGTLDRATANDALNKLDELAGNKDVPGNPADDPHRNRSTDPASYAANPNLDPNRDNRNNPNLDPNRDSRDPASYPANPGVDPASRNPNTGNPTRDPNQPNRNPAGNPETPAARTARESREGRTPETPEARAAREAREGR